MALRTSLGVASLVLFSSSVALAEGESAPSAPPAQTLTCGAADVFGIAPNDAATAVDLVCRAIARSAHGNPGAYLVSLRPLGRVVVLTVAVTQPSGLRDERSIRLASIEEVPVVAPRVADALVSGKALADTQRVDNLVGEEVREAPRKPTETRWSVGVIGVSLPASGVYAMPGVVLGLGYETAQFGALVDFRAAGRDSSRSASGSLFSLAIGGRYFFTPESVAPFVGGGFAWTGITGGDESLYGQGGAFRGSASGLWPWAEVGVQLFRLHQSRLTMSVRADVPFQALRDTSTTYVAGPTGSPGTYRASDTSRYELPVTIAASYSF